MHKEFDELHNSTNYYYELYRSYPCNVIVLPINDDRIEWLYDSYSNRQCARPYVSKDQFDSVKSNILKVWKKNGASQGSTIVHPVVWEALQQKTRGPPGDVVAKLQRMKKAERRQEIECLRQGGDICVYFKEDMSSK